jgi:hypothetical protein
MIVKPTPKPLLRRSTYGRLELLSASQFEKSLFQEPNNFDLASGGSSPDVSKTVSKTKEDEKS